MRLSEHQLDLTLYTTIHLENTLQPRTKSQTTVLYPHFDTELDYSGDAGHQ
jgi:hypothetical protein